MDRNCVDDMTVSIHYSVEGKMLKVSGMNCNATYGNINTYDRVLECVTDFIEGYVSRI